MVVVVVVMSGVFRDVVIGVRCCYHCFVVVFFILIF